MSGESPKDTGDLTRRATGYGLFMLTIVYAFNFIDRQILVILQEPIKQEMGLSDAQLRLQGLIIEFLSVTHQEAVSEYLKRPVSPSDVVHKFAGLRPLYDDGSSAAKHM